MCIRDSIRAPKEEMLPLVLGFSETTRKDSPSRRIWINLLRKVKNNPAAKSRRGTHGMYRTPLMAVTTESMPSRIWFIGITLSFLFSDRGIITNAIILQETTRKCKKNQQIVVRKDKKERAAGKTAARS